MQWLNTSKRYYNAGSDFDFIKYRQAKGEDSTLNLEELIIDKADVYYLLDSLKNAYIWAYFHLSI